MVTLEGSRQVVRLAELRRLVGPQDSWPGTIALARQAARQFRCDGRGPRRLLRNVLDQDFHRTRRLKDVLSR